MLRRVLLGLLLLPLASCMEGDKSEKKDDKKIDYRLPRYVSLYERLGGHSADIVSVADVIREIAPGARIEPWPDANPWPFGDKS